MRERESWEDDQWRDLHCRSQESPWPERLELGPFRTKPSGAQGEDAVTIYESLCSSNV